MWGENSFAILRQALFAFAILSVTSCFHETNHPPTANAGANISASINSLITLDGSASSDVDGDRLRYQWEITEKPENSTASLSDDKIFNPQLLLDVVGLYAVKLVVSDGKLESKPDVISISTYNEKPVASITEVSVRNGSHYVIGDTIRLDASQSSDPENENLFYNWELTVKPENSNASLSSLTALNPFFTVDVGGHYIVHLIVSDGTNLSEPEMMIFEIEQPSRKTNTKPFAEAGPDQPLYQASTMIQLDGSGSYDIENDSLNYRWEFIFKPAGSNAVLSDARSMMPQFMVDVMGSYVVKLVVSDVDGDSHLDTVIVTPHEDSLLACGDCHNNEIAAGKLPDHLLTYDDCFQCHFIDKWKPSKGVVHFHSHAAQPAQCDICHNGEAASGKNADHVLTDKDCNHCHRVSNGTWVPAFTKPTEPEFSHKGIYSGCTACHDNVLQQGKPEGHMPVSDRCFACHTTSSWVSELHLEHTQIFNQCDLCHNGTNARGKVTLHVGTAAQCDQCHQKVLWNNPLLVDHPAFTGPCSACHDKPDEFSVNKHLPTSNVCEKCHNTVAWKPAITVDHAEVIGGCIDCHNNAKGKAGWKFSLHANTTNNCESCHNVSVFRPVLSVDHNEVVSACADCHNGKISIGKIQNHFPATDVCEACHSTNSFTPVAHVNHPNMLGGCVDCHNNQATNGKSSSHIAASDNCFQCHGVSMWSPILTVDHAEVIGICTSCHNGLIARGKKPDHIDVMEDCGSCHGTLSFVPLLELGHLQFKDSCVRCHNGVLAAGKSNTHHSTSNACEACHSVKSWSPANVFNHAEAVEACVLCHNGSIASGWSVKHDQSNDECHLCHVATAGTWFRLSSNVHFYVDRPCTDCHASPNQHLSVGIVDQCASCHIVASWGNPARTLVQ